MTDWQVLFCLKFRVLLAVLIQVFWGVKLWTGSHGHFYKTEQAGRSFSECGLLDQMLPAYLFHIACECHSYCEHHKELIWMQSFEMTEVTTENLICCGTVTEMVFVWDILKFYCLFSSASHSHFLLRPICEGVCQNIYFYPYAILYSKVNISPYHCFHKAMLVLQQ